MSLSQCLKERVISIHSKQQLSNNYTKVWRDQDHFAGYLSSRRNVHALLDTVIPGVVDIGLVHRLHTDLQSLDIDYMHVTPRTNLYTEYLAALHENRARGELVAHAYCYVGAHISGGGAQIASTASGVLPPWFLWQSEYFNIPDRDSLRKDIIRYIDQEATYMTPIEMVECVQEVDTAYRFATLLLNQ